ncbi:hypothetical protein HK096_010119 [Nowakowskiella sp. JEL0078]|nr:hypothetical protein HK096_010119 [Nowakowskiella sp. JEL0078]
MWKRKSELSQKQPNKTEQSRFSRYSCFSWSCRKCSQSVFEVFGLSPRTQPKDRSDGA